jgi:hypothetical protein
MPPRFRGRTAERERILARQPAATPPPQAQIPQYRAPSRAQTSPQQVQGFLNRTLQPRDARSLLGQGFTPIEYQALQRRMAAPPLTVEPFPSWTRGFSYIPSAVGGTYPVPTNPMPTSGGMARTIPGTIPPGAFTSLQNAAAASAGQSGSYLDALKAAGQFSPIRQMPARQGMPKTLSELYPAGTLGPLTGQPITGGGGGGDYPWYTGGGGGGDFFMPGQQMNRTAYQGQAAPAAQPARWWRNLVSWRF